MFACLVDWIEGSESVSAEDPYTRSKYHLNKQEAVPLVLGGVGMFAVKQL